MSLVVGLQGYSFAPCGVVVRIGYLVAALLLIDPGLVTDLVGALLVAACVLAQWLSSRRSSAAARASTT